MTTETMREIKERVKRGADLLRQVDPQWYNNLDLARINIRSAHDCILGQLFGGFPKGANLLRVRFGLTCGGIPDTDFSNHGFEATLFHDSDDVDNLHEVWRKTIGKLKEKS